MFIHHCSTEDTLNEHLLNKILYFCVIRHISLISACCQAVINTLHYVHFTNKCIEYETLPCKMTVIDIDLACTRRLTVTWSRVELGTSQKMVMWSFYWQSTSEQNSLAGQTFTRKMGRCGDISVPVFVTVTKIW